MRRLLVLAICTALSAAACSAAPQQGADEDSLSVKAADEERDGAAAKGSSTTGRAAGGTTAPGSSSSRAVDPTGAKVAPGPGGTAVTTPKGELLVGLYYDESSPSAGNVFADGKALGEAVVNYINARGGFGGHKVKLVLHGSDGSFSPTEDQAACTTFSRDHRVVAAASIASITPTYYQCMGERGVVMVDGAGTVPDHKTFMKYGNVLYAAWPSADRIGATSADALARQGYFRDAGMKLGVLYLDHPWWKTELSVFLGRLRAARVTATDVISVCGQGCDDSASQLQNAVVKMRGDGITHVTFIGPGAQALEFIPIASGQGYFPRYGLTSADLPELIAISNSPSSLRNAVGIGFAPAFDVEPAQEGKLTPGAELCFKIARDAGLEPRTGIASIQVRGTCDTLFLIKGMLDRAPDTSPAGLRTGLEGVGNAFSPAAHFTTNFGPKRHDGAAGYKDIAYNVGCKCFEYRGGVRPMSNVVVQ